MSFESRETSRHGGQPIEGFRFVQGSNIWQYTSADRVITLPIGSFTPITISRSAPQYDREDASDAMEFHVEATNPVAVLFIGDQPSTPVWVTAYKAHRDEESYTTIIFKGMVTRVRFEESEAVLVGTGVGTMLMRNVPPVKMQTPCCHALFSVQCGADSSACQETVTIGTVEGITVTSSDFALQSDQWFRGGRLLAATGATRLIVDHVGDTVTLMSPLPGLATTDVVTAYWGCDHLEETCATKFGQLDNYLGWSRLPNRNPFTSRID
jgi:uncharacterized phage protein (TIGR02218 family)